MTKKKIGLALGGGGARGFCHIGVLQVLQEHNIPIHVVTGCSMGALVGGGFAAGISAETMVEVATSTSNHTVFDLDYLRMLRLRPGEGGLAKGERAMNLYKKYVGEKLIEECDIKFAAIASDLVSKELHVFETGPLWQAVRASMSIPGLFHPVRMDGKILVDGGVMKRIPIEEAYKLGADFVIAVDAIGPPVDIEEDASSMFKIIEISYQILDWKAAQHEGKSADIVITPQMGTKSAFKFGNSEEAIQAGRDAATAALPQIFKMLGM